MDQRIQIRPHMLRHNWVKNVIENMENGKRTEKREMISEEEGERRKREEKLHACTHTHTHTPDNLYLQRVTHQNLVKMSRDSFVAREFVRNYFQIGTKLQRLN